MGFNLCNVLGSVDQQIRWDVGGMKAHFVDNQLPEDTQCS
jgi:hypothetical protein